MNTLQKNFFVLKLTRLSRLCGCGAMKESSRGKSELHEAGCRLTAGEGDFKESATEKNRPKGQGWKGEVRAHRSFGNAGGSVNPTWSKIGIYNRGFDRYIRSKVAWAYRQR